MLARLTIKNAAVIEHAEIEFTPGLNVLTGETGAGKSIIIDSINAILGERASREIVRTGAEKASFFAEFVDVAPDLYDKLNELEIDASFDESILIQRSVSADGRSSCRINGTPVSASVLRQIGNELITVCGQHDSQKLLQSSSHIKYIDALANIEDELKKYRSLYNHYRNIQKELSALQINENEKEQRLDFLSYQIKELEGAEIKEGEKEQLSIQKKAIQNRESILNALNNIVSIINGNDKSSGISDLLRNLLDNLSKINSFGYSFDSYEETFESIIYEFEECSNDAFNSLASFDSDDLSINEIEERLDIIYRMSKKYGNTETEMLKTLEKLKEQFETIQSSDEEIRRLNNELDKTLKSLYEKAYTISALRKKEAAEFSRSVVEELKQLNMNGAEFEVRFEQTKPTNDGIDSLEFIISPNPGQELKPLSKIASGGELSRIMLALRCILSDKETLDTMIFDEIDSGVSGSAAGKIASKLRQLSSIKQVICVTHLPQIAAGADNHLIIQKTIQNNNTFTEVRALDYDQRVQNIARLISGDSITNSVIESAKEMISFAKE